MVYIFESPLDSDNGISNDKTNDSDNRISNDKTNDSDNRSATHLPTQLRSDFSLLRHNQHQVALNCNKLASECIVVQSSKPRYVALQSFEPYFQHLMKLYGSGSDLVLAAKGYDSM
jgi:hypothetical protein